MHHARRRKTQHVGQLMLPGCRRKQVLTAHNICHLLIVIVHHHYQLIGEQAIGALDDHIANGLSNVLGSLPHPPIGKGVSLIRHSHAPGAGRAASGNAGPTGAGVGAFAILAQQPGLQGIAGNFLACTGASVNQALFFKLLVYVGIAR